MAACGVAVARAEVVDRCPAGVRGVVRRPTGRRA